MEVLGFPIMQYSRSSGTYCSFPADLKHRSREHPGNVPPAFKVAIFYKIVQQSPAAPASSPAAKKQKMN